MIATERENHMKITDNDPDTFDLAIKMNHMKMQICTNCGKEFMYMKRLSKHIDKEPIQKTKYNCDQCGKEYQNSGHLMRHMKTHIDIYLCPKCSDKFYNKNKT